MNQNSKDWMTKMSFDMTYEQPSAWYFASSENINGC